MYAALPYPRAIPGTRWATVPGDLFAVPREHVGAVLLAEALEAALRAWRGLS